MNDWEEILRAEGMPDTLGVKRTRPNKKRTVGNDPRPLREVPLEYEPSSPTVPETPMEALMLGASDSMEEQEQRFSDMLQVIAEIDEAALVILSGMEAGRGEASLAAETGLPRLYVRDLMKTIRAKLADMYGIDDD